MPTKSSRSKTTRNKISQHKLEFHKNLGPPPIPEAKKCLSCALNGDTKMKPASEFYLRKGKPRKSDGLVTVSLEPNCKKCVRERVRKGRLALSPEERRRRNQEKRKRFIAKYGRDYENEIKRFSKQKARERDGKQRAFAKDKLGRKGGRLQADPKLPVEPFRAWILERADFYARSEEITTVNPEHRVGVGRLAEICGVSDRTLRRFIDGRENGREITHVPLGTVDQCLTNEGSTTIWQLFDEQDYLYR